MANEYRVSTHAVAALYGGPPAGPARVSTLKVMVLRGASPIVEPNGHRYWRLRPTLQFNGGIPPAVRAAWGTAKIYGVGGEWLPCTGTVASQYDSTSGYDASQDDSYVTRTLSADPIVWDFGAGAAAVIGYYDVAGTTTTPGESVKSWVLEYSDDTLVWTVADTQTNVSAWGAAETRRYAVSYSGGGGGGGSGKKLIMVH